MVEICGEEIEDVARGTMEDIHSSVAGPTSEDSRIVRRRRRVSIAKWWLVGDG